MVNIMSQILPPESKLIFVKLLVMKMEYLISPGISLRAYCLPKRNSGSQVFIRR